MKTKIQLVSQAFDELRINGITSKAENEDVVLALQSLEQLMSELTFDIGWRFEDNPDPNSSSGIPLYAESAVYLSLAVRIAPRYGKDANLIRMQAESSMSRLMARVCKPRQINYPSRMPMGLGNRRSYRFENQFMPVVVQAPISPNTESLAFGDVRELSVDFSGYLQPNESVVSYSKEASQGVLVTADSLSGNVITFTVQARNIGYEYIMFKVNGDAGTVANRRIDFNISSTESTRGNP